MRTAPFVLHDLLHSADLLKERLCERLAQIGAGPHQARIIDAWRDLDNPIAARIGAEHAKTPAKRTRHPRDGLGGRTPRTAIPLHSRKDTA